MKRFFALLSIFAVPAMAAEAPAHIRNLSGCFNVTYRYVENGEYDKYIGKIEIGEDKKQNAIEWIQLTSKEGKHSLQHVGIFDGEVVKHWREDWELVEGSTWLQRVYGPSGAFRYECKGSLDLNQLRCAYAGAPKPVRDRNRKDYDVLDRDQFLQMTPKNWIQSEINAKVKEEKKEGVVVSRTIVAREVGWNDYRRIDENHCEAAKKQFPSD